MSRKHYKEMAAVFKKHRANMPHHLFLVMLADFCDMLQNDNPRFDRQRFMEAVIGA